MIVAALLACVIIGVVLFCYGAYQAEISAWKGLKEAGDWAIVLGAGLTFIGLAGSTVRFFFWIFGG